MAKTIREINEKIQEGKTVVVTAEEIIAGILYTKARRDYNKAIREQGSDL